MAGPRCCVEPLCDCTTLLAARASSLTSPAYALCTRPDMLQPPTSCTKPTRPAGRAQVCGRGPPGCALGRAPQMGQRPGGGVLQTGVCGIRSTCHLPFVCVRSQHVRPVMCGAALDVSLPRPPGGCCGCGCGVGSAPPTLSVMGLLGYNTSAAAVCAATPCSHTLPHAHTNDTWCHTYLTYAG